MNFKDDSNLKALVASAPIGICILNAETFVAEMLNEKFLEIAGKPREAILDKWYWEPFAEARAYFEQAMIGVVTSGEAFYADEVELMLVRHGKEEYIFVTFIYAPVCDENGKVSKLAVWVVENTTQVREREKIAAQKLMAEKERDRLYDFFNQAPAGICVLAGEEFVYELVNPIYQSLLKGRELMGRPMFDALPELKGTEIERVLNEVYQTGNVAEFKEMLIPIAEFEGGPLVDRYFTFTYVPRFDTIDTVDGIFVFAYEMTAILESKFKSEQASDNLEQIINMLPASVVVIRGYDLIVEMINNSNLDYWKKTKAEVIGKPFLEILPDLADQPFASQLRHVMATGEILDVKESPVLFTMADGSVRETFVDYTYQPLSDLEGNRTGVLVMSFEITDRVLSQKLQEKYAKELAEANLQLHAVNDELARSESRFKYLIQEAPVAIGVLQGRELIVESANVKILEVWGKTAAILGLPLYKALPELEGQAFLSILDEVYTSGVPFTANEIRALLEHDGELKEIFFNVVYQPVVDSSGSTADILVVAVDVSEQVRSRRQVEHAEQTLRLALEAANVGTWYIHSETRELIASDRLKELFGFYPEDEMTLPHAIEMITEEFRETVKQAIETAITKGGNYDVSYKVIGFRDKKVRWVRALGNLKLDLSGEFSAFTGVVMDITDQMEDELRKNDFIGMVSHELKTPLTSLSGHLQFLQRKANKGSTTAASAFEQPLKQVRQMTEMIAAFLNVSRLDSGKIHIDKTAFDISELIQEIQAEHLEYSASHSIVLNLCNHIVVNADRPKIAQVINNLVSNAVKYSPHGTQIELTCVVHNGMVKVGVSDQGIGIREQDLSRLFERYYRVENNNNNVSGFGIGLYLSAEIIERHLGKIWAESEYGNGSAFYFELPV
ncbi:MAG: PAS domain-containing protein [Pedobacter sp.]|jgi:PAS domain S-box-containing protein|uniref:PAS domain-containing protein n=1 Tax=Pedobacter sp. TaxID=1411316 RepID=UPI003562C725